MNSYILQSEACRHCDPSQVDHFSRRILRTPTSDICTNCGAVLQTFPALYMTCDGENAPISIPPAVSVVLEQLLTRRLFRVARGHNPRKAERPFNVANTPAHRASDQALIELAGRGNIGATIRWNYSDVELYERARRELKTTSLDTVTDTMPVKIRRTLDVVHPHLDFTGLVVDPRSDGDRWLRFEKSFALPAQPLDLARLCLVVKVELHWFSVGESFPSETGPRQFYLGQSWDPPHMTLEEAVDAALHNALNGVNKVSIWSAVNRGHQICTFSGIGSYDVRQGCGYGYADTAVFGPRDRYWSGSFVGVVSSGDRGLLPTNQYGLNLNLRTPAHVTATFAGATIVDQAYEAGKHQVEAEKLLAGKTGTLVVTFKRAEGDTMLEFDVVADAVYQAARNRIVENFKRAELARLKQQLMGRDYVPEQFAAGEKVAALIGTQWYEGVFQSGIATKGGFLVTIAAPGGTGEWSVLTIKRLADALAEGLEIHPPYDPRTPHLQARLERIVPVS